jgi:alcohol dehydrogenase class IV
MNFEFATANRIIFGTGTFAQTGELARSLGKRAFVVTGGRTLKASGRLGALEESLAKVNVSFFHFAATGEPEIKTVETAMSIARQEKCDLVVGVGGGSSIDLAKAVAGLLNNEGGLRDYLEVVGRGQKLRNPAAPLIAVPTTAGTGAEVTANAVIKDPATLQKVSLRSPFLLPRIAVVDPELTYSLPPEITAQSGLDALVHLIEAYTSRKSQPLTDALCRDGITRAGRSLMRAYDDGNDRDAREEMALSSLEGGLALANAGLGAVHGFAGVLGGAFPVPHGVACACLLPHVFEANTRKLKEESPDSPVLRKHVDVCELLTGTQSETPDEAIERGLEFILDLNRRLNVAPLSRFGVKQSDLDEIARKSAQASSMKANPVTFSEVELLEILRKALSD